MTKSLDVPKGWLSPLIYDESYPTLMAERAKIEKKDMNIMGRYWLGLLATTLCHPKMS